MLHRSFCSDSRRFENGIETEAKAQRYELHFYIYINSTRNWEESFRRWKIWKFVKKKKRKKEFSRCFFPVFDYQSFDANDWPGKSVFLRIRTAALAFLPILGNVWSSCFPHSRENLSRGILIREISPDLLSDLPWITYIPLFSQSLETWESWKENYFGNIQIYIN